MPTLQSQKGAPSGKKPGATRKRTSLQRTSAAVPAAVIEREGTKVFLASVTRRPMSRIEKLVVLRMMTNIRTEIASISRFITQPGGSMFR